jgi:hypothetical protein
MLTQRKTSVIKTRGNPNWGKANLGPSLMIVVPSAFETRAKELNLEPHQFEHSPLLRRWAQQNMNSKYVPEALLKTWNLVVSVRLE